MLKELEVDLVDLLDSSEDLIWSVGLNHRLTFFNAAFQRTFNCAPGKAPALNLLPADFLSSDEAALFSPLYNRALAEGPFRVEENLRDGRILQMAFNRMFVEGDACGVSVIGRVVQGIANAMPIVRPTSNEERQALETLREREAQLRNAEMIALAGSSIWDADTDTSTWSEGLFRIMGLDPKSPVPTSEERHRYYTRESWERIVAAARRSIKTGEPYELDLQIIRKDGQTRWVFARGVAIRNAAGRVAQIAGTLRDITDQKRIETKLRESEERYRATFEQAAIGIVHTAFDGHFLRCNERFARIVGYTVEEIKGITFRQITAPEGIASSIRAIQEMVSGKSAHASWEKRYIRKDGAMVWVRLTSSIQRDEAGRPLHLETFVEDISARKAAEEKLARAQGELCSSEVRYRTIFQSSLDGIVISRLDDGCYIDVNQAFLNMMGYERSEVVGHTSLELAMWTDVKFRQDIVDLLRRDSSFRNLSIPSRRKDGNVLWIQLSAAIVEMDGVQCIVCVARDTSEIRAAEERIKELAFYDQLTRLPNRSLLLDRIESPLGLGIGDTGDRALLFIDLDDFKKLNDTLGQHAGDLVLQEVGRRLTACVRGADTVARCGGDAFAVLLEGLGRLPEPAATQAQFVASKIASVIAQPYRLAGHEYHGHCSIGVTVFGSNTQIPLQILQQAELALHQAKIEGRNAIRFFAPDLQAAVTARATIEDELRLAIRDNQFVLYYQPQVDSSGLIGAEALVRWNHPKRGLLAPSYFISLAEQTGLILPLGECILEAACNQIAAWGKRSDPPRIGLSVNISAKQFHQPTFVELVSSVLYITGANPEYLRLELTESSLVEDIESVIGKMTALKQLGVRFSIDDFGAGYSSLSYLKRLPIDQLKIDRSFVDDILVNEAGGAIAQAIVSLSRALGLSVIAEGVETEAQRTCLIHLGCEAFQGYLFGSPVPIDVFEKRWFARTKPGSGLFLTPRPGEPHTHPAAQPPAPPSEPRPLRPESLRATNQVEVQQELPTPAARPGSS